MATMGFLGNCNHEVAQKKRTIVKSKIGIAGLTSVSLGDSINDVLSDYVGTGIYLVEECPALDTDYTLGDRCYKVDSSYYFKTKKIYAFESLTFIDSTLDSYQISFSHEGDTVFKAVRQFLVNRYTAEEIKILLCFLDSDETDLSIRRPYCSIYFEKKEDEIEIGYVAH